jgi:hypothetical protein
VVASGDLVIEARGPEVAVAVEQAFVVAEEVTKWDFLRLKAKRRHSPDYRVRHFHCVPPPPRLRLSCSHAMIRTHGYEYGNNTSHNGNKAIVILLALLFCRSRWTSANACG